ncbi:50S ribosomal protein L25 [Vaginisenegalia massiliensis]|uniref:50S ribosomal protein L25 n=1 Tax=Vaginisenegalia massiliensis TaxID=2058294 RepID=UPI000F540EA9|nr:50S ribosomal protein L25 [Vaginisenegalia massiliensis]
MVLKAELREKTGTAVSRQARAEGKIPAILYGGKVENTPLFINRRDFEAILKEDGANAVFDIEYDGKKQKVLIKDFTKGAIKNEFYNVDLQAITANQKLQVEVPLILVNTETIKEGVVEQVLNSLLVETTPDNIPGSIEVDVTGLEIGSNKLVSDIEVPQEVSVLEDPEKTIVTIGVPTEEPAPETGEEEAEPEVIGEEDKADEDSKEN